MTREEQIAKKARKLAIQYTKDYDDEGKEVYDIGTEVACLEMAEWIDAHPKEGLVSIDKAVEWFKMFGESFVIRDFLTGLSYSKDEIVMDFKKAMEE